MTEKRATRAMPIAAYPNRMRKKSIDRRFAAIHRLGHVRKPLI